MHFFLEACFYTLLHTVLKKYSQFILHIIAAICIFHVYMQH